MENWEKITILRKGLLKATGVTGKKGDSEHSLHELISWRMVAIIENKPTSLQSHFVGQDNLGCFKNMA